MDMTHINAWNSPPVIAMYFGILMFFIGIPLVIARNRRRGMIIGFIIGVAVNIWVGWMLKNGMIK